MGVTNNQPARYQIGEYTLDREEQLDSKGHYRMFWVLRKNGNPVHMAKTKEDMILEMMIWSADAMEA